MRTIDKINYYLTKENKNGADLCEYLGVSSGVYSQWNTGRTHPRKSKLPIIAEYLGVEVSDIQGDDTNKKRKAHRTRRWAYIRFARKHSKTHFYLLAEPGFYCFAIKSCAADAKSAS